MKKKIIILFFYVLYVFLLYTFFNNWENLVFVNNNIKTIQNNWNIEKNYNFISWIQFFAQAPFWTKQDWEQNETSCEEATIWLYVWWLKKQEFTKQSFDDYLQKVKKFQVKKYWYEPELSGIQMVRFINSYFTGVVAYLVENLTEIKISWLLKENKPIIIWVNTYNLNNPYYHWWRYHTLLIVWENKDFYIVKDVWTKHWNNFLYLKSKVLKAIKETGSWWVVIKKWGKNGFVNIHKNYDWISSDIMIKNFYDNLIFDKHNWKIINLPKNIKWGILSHHLLVAPLFDNYFRLLKQTKPDIRLFVIWWTNHFNFDDTIWTTNLDYITPYWNIKISPKIQDLLNNWILKLNNNILRKEHSIFTITPFIKKYYPQAKILPFIVNNEVSKDKLDDLAKEIEKILSWTWVFYLQSTDFSHYIPDNFRKFYDLYSKNALYDWDISRIDNMWVDWRKLMYFTMKMFWNLWYRKVYILFNTSSNEYLWVKNIKNTSYFFLIFENEKICQEQIK